MPLETLTMTGFEDVVSNGRAARVMRTMPTTFVSNTRIASAAVSSPAGAKVPGIPALSISTSMRPSCSAMSAIARVHATRLAAYCVDWLSGQIVAGKREWGFVGLTDGALSTVPLKAITDLVDTQFRRPIDQWWLELQPIMEALAAEPPE
jgi:hypothetical protein